MRTLLLALAGLGVAAAAPGGPRRPRHDITVDVRGPLALVEVTRVLPRAATRLTAARRCWTWRCPTRARWSRSRCATAGAGAPPRPPPGARARDALPRREQGAGPDAGGRAVRRQHRLPRARRARRRPRGADAGRPSATASPRRPTSRTDGTGCASRPRRSACRSPADVTVTIQGAADVEIAGTRTRPRGGAGRSARAAPPRAAGWEVSWAPRDPAAAARRAVAGRARGDGGAVADGDRARLRRSQPRRARRGRRRPACCS